MNAKQTQLEQIATDIVKNNICPDLAEQATQLVMGDGDPNSEVIFIGEAPGKKEDLQGLPFIGAAGSFLDALLVTVGLQRSEVYITNIVKYRPPSNRDPSPAEKAAFWPYTLQQLQVIQPKVVITLGRHSMEYFLPGVKIGDIHGQPQQVELGGQSITVLPLYHPAAALYNGKLRQTLLDDFEKIPGLLAG